MKPIPQSAIRNPHSQVPVLGGPSPLTVEVAPGQFVVQCPAGMAPRVGVHDLQPAGDGTLRPIVRIHARNMRLTVKLPAQLGLGVSYKTLIRLIRTGFVDGSQVGPRNYDFNLQSYYDHRERCKDMEFWQTKVDVHIGSHVVKKTRLEVYQEGL